MGLSASIGASFSRSFWLGLAGACAVGGLLFWCSASSWRERWYMILRPFVAMLGGVVLLMGLAFFPLWPGEAGFSGALRSRFAGGEAAVSSRWSLLLVLQGGIAQHPLLGSGLGASLTYTSSDPRIVQSTGGVYTTYAFEWGWLDLWYKLGLVGTAAIVWWLLAIVINARRHTDTAWIWLSVFLVATVHVFTPYINHPLGIGLLILLTWWAIPDQEQKKEPRT